METDEQLEQRYGPLAPHSDYKRGEKIRYRLFGSQDDTIYTGTIIWVCLPRIFGEQQRVPTHFIVQRDDSQKTIPDTVFYETIVT